MSEYFALYEANNIDFKGMYEVCTDLFHNIMYESVMCMMASLVSRLTRRRIISSSYLFNTNIPELEELHIINIAIMCNRHACVAQMRFRNHTEVSQFSSCSLSNPYPMKGDF